MSRCSLNNTDLQSKQSFYNCIYIFLPNEKLSGLKGNMLVSEHLHINKRLAEEWHKSHILSHSTTNLEAF